jgi:peptidoglycan hydrolase-like protein with peptidoglycan-binding domain
MRRTPLVRLPMVSLLLGVIIWCSSFSPAAANSSVYVLSEQEMAHSVATISSLMPNACPSTLSQGSKGPLVKKLQDKLNRYYHYGYFWNAPYDFQPDLVVDGDFGPLTRNAVLDFQRAYFFDSREWDGIVGPHTWAALGFC